MSNVRQISRFAPIGERARSFRRCAHVAIAAALAATLAGCAGSPGEVLETSALAPAKQVDAASKPARTDRPATNLADLKARHQAAPNDPSAALAYATALKGAGQVRQARDVIAAVHAAAPANTEITGSLGLLELELGEPAKAQKLLQVVTKAPDADWRYHSGLGVALALQGKSGDARDHLQKALAKSPGNKAVLNNLALTYVMDKKLDQAEGLLRQAKAGDDAPVLVAKNLELAGRLRGAGAGGERRADNDAPPGQTKQKSATN